MFHKFVCVGGWVGGFTHQMWKLVLEDLVLQFVSVAAELEGHLIRHSVSIFLLPCVGIDTWNESIYNHTCIPSNRFAPVHIIKHVYMLPWPCCSCS